MNSLGPNSDGFDPDGCDHVLIEGCTFSIGDDCIAIKSGKTAMTQFGASRNIVIQDCVMNSATVASRWAAKWRGIENDHVQNIEFRNIHRPATLADRDPFENQYEPWRPLRHFHARHLNLPNGVEDPADVQQAPARCRDRT
jgi:hypothetical protein